MGSDNSILSPK